MEDGLLAPNLHRKPFQMLDPKNAPHISDEAPPSPPTFRGKRPTSSRIDWALVLGYRMEATPRHVVRFFRDGLIRRPFQVFTLKIATASAEFAGENAPYEIERVLREVGAEIRFSVLRLDSPQGGKVLDRAREPIGTWEIREEEGSGEALSSPPENLDTVGAMTSEALRAALMRAGASEPLHMSDRLALEWCAQNPEALAALTAALQGWPAPRRRVIMDDPAETLSPDDLATARHTARSYFTPPVTESYVVRVGEDAANQNNRRFFVDGSQWAKVYGWDSASVEARCAILKAAMERGRAPDTDCVSLLADLDAGKPVHAEAAAVIRGLISEATPRPSGIQEVPSVITFPANQSLHAEYLTLCDDLDSGEERNPAAAEAIRALISEAASNKVSLKEETTRAEGLLEGEASKPFADLVEAAWLELGEREDRTSPEEYPDMCLITREEVAEFMARPVWTGPVEELAAVQTGRETLPFPVHIQRWPREEGEESCDPVAFVLSLASKPWVLQQVWGSLRAAGVEFPAKGEAEFAISLHWLLVHVLTPETGGVDTIDEALKAMRAKEPF